MGSIVVAFVGFDVVRDWRWGGKHYWFRVDLIEGCEEYDCDESYDPQTKLHVRCGDELVETVVRGCCSWVVDQIQCAAKGAS